MRAISRRLNKLEHKLGMAPDDRILMIVTASATKLGLDEDTSVKILDEAGFLATRGIASVDLLHIPSGLSASETKRYLLKNGAEICGSRLARLGWRMHPLRLSGDGRRLTPS
jgi:hypothetical protein